ncbi:hypothetical protein ABK040_005023 [Willaertia magna]
MNNLLRSSKRLVSSCCQSKFMMNIKTPAVNYCFNTNNKFMSYHTNLHILKEKDGSVKIGGEELKEQLSPELEEPTTNVNEQQQEQLEQTESIEEIEEVLPSGPIRLSNIIGGETDPKYDVYTPPVYTNLPMNEVRELKFAVVQVEGHQYKVTNGDRITVNRIPIEVGTQISLDKILLVGAKDFTAIGRPIVEGAKVLATVEQHTRTAYVIAFKKRRRKMSKRWKGNQQPITTLRIDDVQFNTEVVVPSDMELKTVCYE